MPPAKAKPKGFGKQSAGTSGFPKRLIVVDRRLSCLPVVARPDDGPPVPRARGHFAVNIAQARYPPSQKQRVGNAVRLAALLGGKEI